MLISFTGQSKNIADYFIDMPLFLMPTLESSYRLELVENYTISGRDTLENRFGTTIKLLDLDTANQHIAVRPTSVSRFEMQLIENQNDTLIGIINTVCAPICSSYIKFYNTSWQEVKMDFPKFSIENWLNPSNNDEQNKQVKNAMRIDFLEYVFSSDGKKVIIHNRSEEQLDAERKEELAGLVDFKKKIEVSLSELFK